MPRVIWSRKAFVNGYDTRIVDMGNPGGYPVVEVLEKDAMGQDCWRRPLSEDWIEKKAVSTALLDLYEASLPEPGGVHRNED